MAGAFRTSCDLNWADVKPVPAWKSGGNGTLHRPLRWLGDADANDDRLDWLHPADW